MGEAAHLERHHAKVRGLGCFVSGRVPVELHHCHGGSLTRFGQLRGVALKTSDWLVIPLHHDYHTGKFGVDRIGVDTWEMEFGSQVAALDWVCNCTGEDVWTRANIKRHS